MESLRSNPKAVSCTAPASVVTPFLTSSGMPQRCCASPERPLRTRLRSGSYGEAGIGPPAVAGQSRSRPDTKAMSPNNVCLARSAIPLTRQTPGSDPLPLESCSCRISGRPKADTRDLTQSPSGAASPQ